MLIERVHCSNSRSTTSSGFICTLSIWGCVGFYTISLRLGWWRRASSEGFPSSFTYFARTCHWIDNYLINRHAHIAHSISRSITLETADAGLNSLCSGAGWHYCTGPGPRRSRSEGELAEMDLRVPTTQKWPRRLAELIDGRASSF
jgi:hypothetical protein